MKLKITYCIDSGDHCSPRLIRESFNLLFEFAGRLNEPESATYKAFHSIVDNREFTREQAQLVANYAEEVAKRAEEKYSKPPFDSAPWQGAIFQNCRRLRNVMADLIHELDLFDQAEKE